ncbi:hypothetical protein ElyMa_002177900 [Elysia marginata]|uniref:Peptidase S1 domain-containing protein n=1 Tax=Elysia marginata TaxID=1093978 RepID=A0AAV4FPT5_9GAST|nr:hypothetical protein ElyMa_002177900 [Elysia marginata]
MKSAWGVEVIGSRPNMDCCGMLCVTCDEDLGKRIDRHDVFHDDPYRHDLSQLGLLPSGHKDCDFALIVSHPHGQPKNITVGEVTHQDRENQRVDYNTPTCPGSSGAIVFRSYRWLWLLPVHCGSFGKTSTENNLILNALQRLSRKLRGHRTEQEQINYGYEW